MGHLIASHIQPSRYSSNYQRLDGENGFSLAPPVGHVFERGFISFENTGLLVMPPVANLVSLNRIGIDHDARVNVGTFSLGRRQYLEFHRQNLLRMAREVSKREHDG